MAATVAAYVLLRTPRSSSPLAAKRAMQSPEYASLAKLIATIRGIGDKYGISSARTPQAAEQNEVNIIRAMAAIVKQFDNRCLPQELRDDNIGDLVTALDRIAVLKRQVGDLSRLNYNLQRTQVEHLSRLSTQFHKEEIKRSVQKMTAFQQNWFDSFDRLQANCEQKILALHQRLHTIDDRIKGLKHK